MNQAFVALSVAVMVAFPASAGAKDAVRSERVSFMSADGEHQITGYLFSPARSEGRHPAIVMLHHNPGLTENVPGLKDTAALLEVIRPRKQVKAYFFGHTHAWGVTQDESGIHFINLPPTAYLFAAGKPSGWVRATAAKDGMKLELRCLDTKHPQHGEVKDLKWRA